MFLTEAYRFYQRMAAEPQSGMPPMGMSLENISFILVLSKGGELKEVISWCNSKGKAQTLMVPSAVPRSSGVASNFLWDNTGYVLGVDGKGKADRTVQTFAAFKEKHLTLAYESHNERLLTLAHFLETWQPEHFTELADHKAILDQNLAFQIEGDKGFLHEQPDMQEFWAKMLTDKEGAHGVCLLSGENTLIARTHPSIKGLPGAQTAGAALVSFNCDAFESYGKKQSYNAPVGEVAARGYVSALNYLLRRDNHQCMDFGDTRAVFWTEKKCRAVQSLNMLIGGMVSGSAKESLSPQDKELVKKLESLLSAIRQGKPVDAYLQELDGAVRFFILGLAPNAARISVRFWHASTFGDVVLRIARHYADCRLEKRYADDADYPSLYAFLLSLAVLGKRENIPPVLGGQMARAIFGGLPYPESMFTAVLQRIRAEKQISYLRASLIAGYLRRNHQRGDITMSLNIERKGSPYILGRLFSLLEKVQRDALGNVNASIKDRYLSAASATPAQVFPLLLRLAQSHIKKISQGNSKFGFAANARIEAVVQSLDGFPSRLQLQEQGDFFLGYYHQCNANFTQKIETVEPAENNEA